MKFLTFAGLFVAICAPALTQRTTDDRSDKIIRLQNELAVAQKQLDAQRKLIENQSKLIDSSTKLDKTNQKLIANGNWFKSANEILNDFLEGSSKLVTEDRKGAEKLLKGHSKDDLRKMTKAQVIGAYNQLGELTVSSLEKRLDLTEATVKRLKALPRLQD